MARGPQVIAQPGGSVAIPYSATTATIQTAINANPGATTFWIEKGGGSGVRAQTSALVPKTGNTFIFEYGAILDGSGWTSTNSTMASFRAHNENIDNVTIENGEIRYMPQKGIHAFRDFSSGWAVRNCYVHHCKDGISLASGAIVQRNVITYNVGNPSSPDPGLRGGGYVFNGAFGITSAILLDDNEIAYNGTEQKFIDCGAVTATTNWFHHNQGAGLWFDGDASGSLITGNTSEDNSGEGIMWEQCRNGTIHTNTIERNGAAGLFISTSKTTEIYNNTLVDNYRSIQLFLNCASVNSQPWNPDLSDLNIHDNIITVPSTSGALANGLSYTTCSGAQLSPYVLGSKNLYFVDNVYTVPGTDAYWFWGNDTKTFAQWQAIPQDSGAAPPSEGGGGGTYVPANSLFFAPYNPDDYGSLVSSDGVYLGLPTNDPLFDTDGFGTVTGGLVQLDNGRICVHNIGDYQTGVFNADLSLRVLDPTEDLRSMAGGYDNGFFYGMRNYPFGGNKRIVKFDSDDCSVVTTYPTGETGSYNWVIAVARDESYAYFSRGLHFPGFDPGLVAHIKRLDLTTLAVTAFITATVSVQFDCMLCLRDGTLIVGWQSGGIKHYATDGTLLHTYAYAPKCVTPGLTDDSFWVEIGIDRAVEIEVATGTALHDITLPTGDPPAAHAGNADSTNWGETFCIIRTVVGSPPVSTTPPPTPTSCLPISETEPSAEPILGLLPSPNETVTYDETIEEVAVISVTEGRTGTTITPSAEGNIWLISDAEGTVRSYLEEADISTGEVIREVKCEEALIAEYGGRHSVFDIGCCGIVTVDRDTHELIRLGIRSDDPEDETVQTATVEQRYSLVIDFLDGQMNSAGERLVYVDGNTLKLWDLPEDALVRTIKDFGFPIRWPVWLKDGSICVFTGDFLGHGDVIRIDLSGKIVNTYIYDHGLFGGLWGMTVAFNTGKCQVEGAGKLYLSGSTGILGIDLLDNTPDEIVAVTPTLGAAVTVTAGFTAIGSAASSLASGSSGDDTGDPPDQTLPPKPDVSCTDSTLSSVAANPGCNPGGRGWTPEYTGPSGTVPTVAEPTTPETWTGKSAIFVEAVIDHTIYDDVLDTETKETLHYAVVELDDDVLKEGRVRSIGSIEKGTGDAQGNLQAATIDIRITDEPGRPIGRRVESTTQRYFARDEIRILGRSDEGRRTNATPKYIGRGLLTGESYSLTSGSDIAAEARFTATDVMFADGGAFSPDKKVPQWVFPTSYYTEAPADIATMFMPIILGEVSDNEPTTGFARGKCPARFMGIDNLDAEPWGRFNACLFAIYKITGLYGSDLGGMGLYGRSLFAVVNKADPKKNIKETTTITLDGSPNLGPVPLGGYAQIVIFTATDRQELRITGKGVSTVRVDGEIDVDQVNGSSWYISYISYKPRRVKIDLTTRNADDCMVPKWPGYTRPTDYEEFLADGDTYRVTDFWVRGPLLAAHLAGEVTLAFNAIGIEDQGDGSGLPIDDFFTAENWFIDNCVHRQLQAPLGGLWPQTDGDLPMFEDGIHKTKQSSFAAAQALSGGLKISGYLNEGISIRDCMQLFNDNSGSRLYIDEYGRIAVWKYDMSDDQVDWPHIDHVSRVFGDVSRVRAHDEILNVIKGGCDWDADGQKFREEIDPPITSAIAVRHNKGVKKYSKHIDGKLVARKTQFVSILEQKLEESKNGAVYVHIQNCDVGMLDYPIGTGIKFTSIMGPGAQGWVNHPMVILRNIFDIDSKMVTLLCIEISGGVDVADGTLEVVVIDEAA